MHPRTDRVLVRLADAAIVCFGLFACGVAAMHVLRPDFAVSTHMISDYSVGPWSSVMTTAFSSASLGSLMLALGVVRSHPNSATGWLAAALLAVASVALAVTAAFPPDPAGAPPTFAGGVHAISFLVNIASLVLAAAMTAAIATRDARWRPHRRPAALLAVLLAIAVVVQFIALHRGLDHGTANRFMVGVMTAWFVVTAIRLRRLALLVS